MDLKHPKCYKTQSKLSFEDKAEIQSSLEEIYQSAIQKYKNEQELLPQFNNISAIPIIPERLPESIIFENRQYLQTENELNSTNNLNIQTEGEKAKDYSELDIKLNQSGRNRNKKLNIKKKNTEGNTQSLDEIFFEKTIPDFLNNIHQENSILLNDKQHFDPFCDELLPRNENLHSTNQNQTISLGEQKAKNEILVVNENSSESEGFLFESQRMKTEDEVEVIEVITKSTTKNKKEELIEKSKIKEYDITKKENVEVDCSFKQEIRNILCNTADHNGQKVTEKPDILERVTESEKLQVNVSQPSSSSSSFSQKPIKEGMKYRLKLINI